jgi:hypothetical protein
MGDLSRMPLHVQRVGRRVAGGLMQQIPVPAASVPVWDCFRPEPRSGR